MQTILRVKTGSHLYGYATATSDTDYISVFYPGEDHYLTTRQETESKQVKVSDDDEHTHEFLKFVKLLCQANPNVLEVIFAPKEFHDISTKWGDMLLDVRNAFISTRVHDSLVGYSRAQRSRMLAENTGKLGAKRKELVDSFGYDTKYAAHALRLLWMAEELYTTGILNPVRKEKDQLYAIRTGYLPKKEAIELVDAEMIRIDAIWEKEKFNFRAKPDLTVIDQMCKKVLYDLMKIAAIGTSQ